MKLRTFKPYGHVICRKIAGEVFLVPVSGRLADMQRIFALNPVGAYIWRHLDGTRTLARIGEAVTDAFDVDPETAMADVAAFVAEMRGAGLVEEKE